MPFGSIIIGSAEGMAVLGIWDPVSIPVEIAVTVHSGSSSEAAGFAGVESTFELPVVREAVAVRVVFSASGLELAGAGVGDHGDELVAELLQVIGICPSSIPDFGTVLAVLCIALVLFFVSCFYSILKVVFAVLDVLEHRERARGHGLPGCPDALLVAGGEDDGDEEGSDDGRIGTHFSGPSFRGFDLYIEVCCKRWFRS